MLLTNRISLRIYGGAQEEGFEKQPLVSVGTAPEGFMAMPPTIVNEQQVWMITHAQSYTMYAVNSKRCFTADDKPGQMLICLFFPAQYRLAEGNSPLGLLDSLTDCFAVQALRDGKLPEKPVDNSPFNTLLERYRLEQRPMQLPVMQGQEPAAFCVENKTQLDALMRHSRYPVLGGVGRLELGFHCPSTITLMTNARVKPQTEKPAEPTRVTPTPPPPPPSSPVDDQSTGGLILDDPDIPFIPETPWYKKSSGIAAIVLGVIVLLLGGLFFLGSQAEQKEKPDEIAAVDSMPDNSLLSADENAAPAAEAAPKAEEQRQTESEAAKKAALEAAKKAAEEAAKKAKEEAAKKAAEEARKAKEEAAKKAREEAEAAKKAASNWKSKVQTHAQSCPIKLRYGVRVKSITCTDNSVTIVVSYDELSKYDMGEDDRAALVSDRSTVIKRYASGLPSGVRVSVVQLDKAGRSF